MGRLSKWSSVVIILLLGSASCKTAESPEISSTCQSLVSPSPPMILSPAANTLHQPDEVLRIEVQPNPTVQDDQTIELELWLATENEPTLKIWQAQTQSNSVELSDGVFTPGFDHLQDWTTYVIRTRAQHPGDECDFGTWSEYREFRTDDGSDAYFDEDVIRDIDIVLSQESYEKIDAEALPPACIPYSRSYYPGTVTFDGLEFRNAGIRVKGGCGSARNLDEKAAFKINLSDYSSPAMCPESRRARGLKRITLNNQIQDPSFTHERLAYHFYELLGIHVPRRAPIRVRVNGQLWGLYLHLESIDRRFLRRRFAGADAEGMLYEGTYFCNMTPDNIPTGETSESCFSKKFDDDCSTPSVDGDPFTYTPLANLIANIDMLSDQDFYSGIQELVHFEQFLSLWAADTIMNHWDGAIFGVLNNYRLYHPPNTGRWIILPTGMDQSFADITPPANYWYSNVDPWDPSNVIASRCLRIKECEDAFAARLAEVRDIFDNANMIERVQSIVAQIADDVAADPRRNRRNFENQVDKTIVFINGRKEFVNTALASHGY